MLHSKQGCETSSNQNTAITLDCERINQRFGSIAGVEGIINTAIGIQTNDSVPGFEGVRKRIAENGLDKTALAMQQKEQPSTSKEELARVKQKVLVICGDKDQDNGNGADLAKLIPKAIFVTVPGNHGSAWHSSEFTAEVLKFLKG